ncbi:unnamed protein product [Cylicocyclus nassatus]|uniref:Secreted protein n=1 Tax=Cylicocyclus nassatus TaxID=53992 RepID=A0AA36H7E4_CYLNA|nr:unnamed protein product [Cylicocyclus nassatus]
MIALGLFFILLLTDICDAAKRRRGCGCKHVLGHTIQHRICKEKCRLRRHYLFDWTKNPPINPTKDPKVFTLLSSAEQMLF